MYYWGKLTGTLAGLATGRPWLALVGLILGHQFDRGFARYSAERSRKSAERLKHLPESFLRPLFHAMGFLAKADGRVTEDEIRAARVQMHRLGLGPEGTRQAIDWFEEGKRPGFPVGDELRQLKSASAAHAARHHALFVQLLLEVSLSKPGVDSRERAALWTICRHLDIGRVELAQIEAMLRAQKSFSRPPAGSRDAEQIRKAYSVLGVTDASTNAEIKQAYRRLMNRNHPDKLSGGLPDTEAVVAAAKRTREIRGAYDMLKARRSIR